jgi:formylglycine-generating enzyme required for sulfatase activity
MGEDVFGLLGRTIDEKVRVDECIGEGGFATVYRGFHLAFEQPVAIKCLKTPPHFDAEARASFLSKFHEEGKMLFRLSQHASIVRVFDLGDVEGSRGEAIPYLVLEWLDGVDLETLSKRRAGEGVGPWKEAEVLKLLRPAVDAIALAHRLGIAHRDLKPSNLVLANTVQGELLKVLDFGIAKAMQDGETTAQRTTRTSSGFHAFSPQYGAPEQFRSKRFGATGPWTDVHAMGLIMTELVAGQPAMLGEEHGDFYEQAMDEVRPTPRVWGADVSDAFEALCRRCLARDPAERIQDADGVLAAMDAVEMGVRELMDQGPARQGSMVSSPVFPTPSEVAETAMAPQSAPIPAVPSLVPGQPSVPEPSATFSPPQAFEIPVPAPKRRWPWVAGAILSAAALAGALLFLWYLPSRAQVAQERLVGVMAQVPGGDFRMGANDGAPDQRPEHEVTVDAFALDVNEVTVEAFGLCVEAGVCQPTETVHLTAVTEGQAEKWNTFCNWGKPGQERHPINCVDWHQAQAYCAWVGKRLPTEREWEFAARGGGENRGHPWGDAKPLAGQFNGCGVECAKMALTHGWKWKPLHDEDDGFPSTAPVGSFPGSKGRWGHQDLAGNVWEWTASPFCNYGVDGPENCSKSNIAARGGGWASRYPGIFRATFRTKYPKEYRSQDVGFRCAR